MTQSKDRLRPFLFAPIRFRPLLPADGSALRLALIPATITFVVYLLALPSSITGDHAGELVTAAALGGVVHPPGHSLWTIGAGSLIAAVPFGSAAWRAALLSAGATALACGLLAVWLRQQDVGRRAAVVAALFLGFGSAVWGQAVVPGVHALTLFLAAALLVAVTQAVGAARTRWILIAGFIAGLGVSHHHAFWGILVAAAVLAGGRRPELFRSTRAYIAAAAAFAAGFAPLLVIPARARQMPYVNSGSAATLPDAFAHLFERGAPSVPWGAADLRPTWLEELTGTALAIWREHLWFGIALALVGFLLVTRRSRADSLLYAALVALPATISLFVGELHGGAPPAEIGPRLLCSMFAAAALIGVAIDLPLQRFGNSPQIRARLWNAGAACLPLLLLVAHFRACDYSNYRYADELATAILEPLSKDAVLFTAGDFTTSPLLYHLGVLGVRPDVVLLDRCGETDWDRLPGLNGLRQGDSALDPGRAIRFLIDEGRLPVFSTAPTPGLEYPYRWEAVGLLYRACSYEDGLAQGAAPTAPPIARFTHLPEDAPLAAAALGGRGAPFDASARRVAIYYYGARARQHNLAGAREQADRAADLVSQLLRGD